MCDKIEEEVIEGKVRTNDVNFKEESLLEWAKKSYIESIDIYNDVLKLLLNLCIPLFSGLIVFFQYFNVYSKDKWYLPFIFLFLSFVSSLIGIFPYTKKINIINVTEIEKFKEKILKKKMYSMIISITLLFISLIAIIYIII